MEILLAQRPVPLNYSQAGLMIEINELPSSQQRQQTSLESKFIGM